MNYSSATQATPLTNMMTTLENMAVRIVNLCKRFDKFTAVDRLNLEVPADSIYGLIGPNGAGKTTTMSVISTLLKPNSGAVSVFGHDPVTDPMAVRKLLGYMPDSLGIYTGMEVHEYLDFFAAAYKIPLKARPALVDSLLELVALTFKRSAHVDSLSRGMKQRLSLARALVHDPKLLVLDEPASGLDPRARAELRDLILQLSNMGKTIIISSHILAELEDVCSHIAVMQSGKVVSAGSISEISRANIGKRTIKVRFADGSSENFVLDSDEAQQELIANLMNDSSRRMVEFKRVGSSLEELFMSVTQEEKE